MYEAIKDAGDYQSNYLRDFYRSGDSERPTAKADPIIAFFVSSCLCKGYHGL